VLVQLKGDRTVPELIKAEFRRAKVKVDLEQIDDWLLADRLILLLDGVNEMPTEDLRRQLAQFREENLSVPMVLTTRDLAIGGDLGIEKRFEMKPLSPEQLREFVGKYLPEGGTQLLQQLRDRLREIAETPLLLKMLCDVFKLTGEVPQNKGELFRGFDREYDKFKGVPAVSEDFRRFKSEVLQHLAYTMMVGDGGVDFVLTIDRGEAEGAIEDLLKGRVDAPGAKAKEWLEDLVAHHLLQVAADGRRLEFHHQLFQEYYAAEWLLGRVREMDDETLDCEFLNLLKWTETVGLMLGLVEDEEFAVKVVEKALGMDLMLGARLAGAVKLRFQKKCARKIETYTLPTLIKLELLGLTNPYSIVDELIDVLEHDPINVRHGSKALHILSRVHTEKSIETIQKAVKHPYCSEIRFSALMAMRDSMFNGLFEYCLDIIEDLHSYDSFLKTIGFSVMLQIDHQRTASLMIRFLEHYDIRFANSVAHSFRSIDGKDFLSDLIRLSTYSNPFVSANAIKALAYIKLEQAFLAIINALNSPHSLVREEAAWALGFHNNTYSLPLLRKALKDKDPDVRLSAASALATMNSYEDIPNLILMLNDESVHVIASVVVALGMLRSKEAIPDLHKLLEHSDSMIRDRAANALGMIKDNTSQIKLAHALHDKAPNVRREAFIALSNFEVVNNLPQLVKTLSDPDAQVRTAAIAAMIKISTEESIEIAFNALENVEVQEELGSISYELTSIGTPNLLKKLWGKVCNHDNFVSLVSVITSIQSNCKFYNYEIHQKVQTCHPPVKQQNTLDTIATDINEIKQNTKTMAEQQPSISISGGTFNGPVNLAPNQGHQPTTIIDTQINYTTDPNLLQTIQNLLQQNTDLKNFITELETQNPHPQTEAEAEAARDKAIATLQNNNPNLWKTIRTQMRNLKHQLLNPDRHAQAAKATLVEVTKAYWEKSLIVKAIVTYIDKLSETPDQGA
jgi:HEAT repeat protein